MNYKILLSYLLILGFFMCLVFAYMKYNDTTTETENDILRQQIVAVLEKKITEIQSQIDILKNNSIKNSQQSLSPNNAEIEAFIKSNPKIIAVSLEDYFNRKNIDSQRQAISDNMLSLLQDFNSGLIKTFLGKADAKLKIIEFYDYTCRYCAQMTAVNKKIIDLHPDIAIIFIEIPMLGPDSVEATKFAIAVSMLDQAKYAQFQDALFNYNLPKNKENLMQLAIKNGIDGVQLQKYLDENLNSIEERIKKNGALFNNMKLQGTPTYIIGNEVLVGAVEFNNINDAILRVKNDIK